MSKQLFGSIALTKLQCMIMRTKKGTLGVFLPIEENMLYYNPDKSVVSMNVNVWLNDEEDDYGNIASIKQNGQIDGKKWNELSEEEQKKIKDLPYVGNLKEFKQGGGNDSSGVQGGGPVNEEDDLPF